MESSGPLPSKLATLFENLEEIQESIAARTGQAHAAFVSCVFSIGNAQVAYQTMLLHKSPESAAAVHHMDSVWSDMMSNMIFLFAEATMKQDPKWLSYADEEKKDKIRNYIMKIKDDTMMLMNKQKQG